MSSEKHIAPWITFFGWIVAIGLILIVGFRFFISTELALRVIEEKIESEIEEVLGADLILTSISGDVWDNLLIEGIEIQKDAHSVSIARLSMKYVLVDLVFGDPVINSLIIDGIDVSIDFETINEIVWTNNTGEDKTEEDVFYVNQIQIIDGDFDIKSNQYLPDSLISLDNLAFQGDLRTGSNQRLGIDDLNFQINHGRLPEAVSFGLDGAITNHSISLNDLIFGMGESIIKGALNADFMSDKLSGIVSSESFDLSDFIYELTPYANKTDFQVELYLSGSFDDFNVKVEIDDPDLQNFNLQTGFLWQDGLYINSVNVIADYVNSSNLFDSLHFIGGPIELELNGHISVLNESTDFEWSAGVSNLEINEYHLEKVYSSGELKESSAIGNLEFLSVAGEDLNASFRVDSVFSNRPSWNLDYFIQNLNPRSISRDFAVGRINASGKIGGETFSFPNADIDITISNKHPDTGENLRWIIENDFIDEVYLSASFSTEKLISEGYLRIIDSELGIEVQAFYPFDLQSEYTYQANFDNVNIGYLSLFEGNTTSLTGGLYGIGNGRSPENASIFGSLTLQSGQINNAQIESFDASVQYENGMLTIREGNLESEIADGEVTGQRDLMDVTNPENRLDLNLNIKNLKPLAGLFGLVALEANGELEGSIQQNIEGVLKGDFELNLSDVMIDSVFSAEEVLGTSKIIIESESSFDASLEIVQPLIKGLVFQDIKMETIGTITSDSLKSDFEINIIGSERGRLIQQGSLNKDIIQELSDIQFTRFDFLSAETDLLLQRPFNIRVFKTDFGTDTLSLSSDTGAFLEFAVPFSSENEAIAFVSGNNFDLGLIQEIVFGERFLDGILSGEVNYHQTPGDVLGNGLTRIDKLAYKGAEADSLIFSFDIINERLNAQGNVYWDSTLAVTAWANVPFVVDKEELDEEFYSRPIRGGLDLQPTNLIKFGTLLNEFGLENTTGIATVNGEMSGEAGSPQITGIVEIDEPELSGIPIDRLAAELSYANSSKSLIIQSEIFALNTPVAELNIAYPLDYDFRTFDLYLPDQYDNIEISAVTNNLNIALFNDFVDPNYINSMNGELNADLQFKGPLGNIQPEGAFNLRNASFEVPYSGIFLENIAMQIDVDSTALTISRMYAESGRGRMSVNGSADLDGIIPTNVLLDVDARLFELINRRDVNFEIDLDATLSGEIERPELIGDLIVNEGYFLLENFGDDLLEDIVLEDEIIESFAPFDSLTIDVIVEFNRDFFIRSSDYLDLELEPSGLLDLKKNRNEQVKLFGVLDVYEGYSRPLGKRFELENGTITFTGSYIDPDLDTRFFYIPQTRQKGESVVLYYLIQGTHLNPDFSFESDPQMEQSDVICYAFFNKPCYSLESWQSVFAEENDAESFQALSDVLLDEFETLATRELGVDIVQIDNSGQNGRTAITTGWYLNERTFFSIINELTSSTPKTLFVLEYLLNENWDLIITQGDDSRQGIDVRYQFDY